MGSLVFSSKSLRLEKGQANVNISFPSSDRWLNPFNHNEVNNILILSFFIFIFININYGSFLLNSSVTFSLRYIHNYIQKIHMLKLSLICYTIVIFGNNINNVILANFVIHLGISLMSKLQRAKNKRYCHLRIEC